MAFGAYIRGARESVGIPLNRFAGQIGLSPAYWSRIERGMEKPPRDEFISKASEILGLPSDDAFIAAGRLPPDIQADLRRAVLIFRESH